MNRQSRTERTPCHSESRCAIAAVFICAACAPGGNGSDASASVDLGVPIQFDASSLRDAQPFAARADVRVDMPSFVPCARRPDTASAACVREVRGDVRDLGGAPRVDVPVTVCGSACFFGRSSSDGTFDVMPGDFVDPLRYSVQAHGRPDFASVIVPLDSAQTSDDVYTLPRPMRLARYTETGPVLPDTGDGRSYRAGDVVIGIPAGTMVEIDLEDEVLGELGHRLRSVRVPVELAPSFATESGTPVSVWALTDVAAE